MLRREIRARDKASKTAKIEKILREFKRLKAIVGIRNDGKIALVGSMQSGDGSIKTDRQDIANVFADFYEALYASAHAEGTTTPANQGAVDKITGEEVAAQIKKVSKNKCADEAGIVPEIIAAGGGPLAEELAAIFDDIIQKKSHAPESWRTSKIVVVYKKGEKQLPENYRPICIIPILYKIFSKVLHKRMEIKLEAAQTRGQAGFRNEFSCDDHLFVVTLLMEKSNEIGQPCWMATLDFKKAFDTIAHEALWRALDEQDIPACYINVLKALYHEQTARVQTDASSRTFNIHRGTKQGDPISPTLFNAVVEEFRNKNQKEMEG